MELRERDPRRRVPRLRTVEEKLEYIAAGSGIVVLLVAAPAKIGAGGGEHPQALPAR
jgi:hypothetical protein